jgi:hypothetical protein
MKSFLAVAAVACLAVAGLASSASAQTDEFRKRSVFTTSEPVEIPGTVLKPGKYVIRLRTAPRQRGVLQIFNVVEVLDAPEEKVLASLFSMPDYNLAPPNKPLFGYYEGGPGLPKSIRVWYYPEDNYGEQFVYPKAQAAELAKYGNQSVLSMPALEAASAANALTAIGGTKEAPPARRTQMLAQANPPAGLPDQLPKTASLYSVLAWVGIICLILAGGIRALYKWIPEVSEGQAWGVRFRRRAADPEVLSRTLEQLRQDNRALATKMAASTYQNYQLIRQLSDKTQ